MAKIRRVVRKVRPPVGKSFDDQLWPVNIALVVLGGFLVGVVFAHLRFDDPSWRANGWTWLSAVAVVIGGAMVALCYASGRIANRSMQLVLVVSVILHVILIIVALNLVVFSHAWTEVLQLADVAPSRKPTEAPQYHWRRIDPQEDPRPDHWRPVETETPETDAAGLEKREAGTERPPTDLERAAAAEPEKTITSHPVRRRVVVETAPRRSEEASRLSRQLARTPPGIQQPAPEPHAPAADREKPTEVRASQSVLGRRPTQVRPIRRSHDQQLVPAAPSEDELPARNTLPENPQLAASKLPALRRQAVRRTVVPAPAEPMSQDSPPARKATPEELKPGSTMARKQRIDVASSRSEVVTPEQETQASPATQLHRRRIDQSRPPMFASRDPTGVTTRSDVRRRLSGRMAPHQREDPSVEMPAAPDEEELSDVSAIRDRSPSSLRADSSSPARPASEEAPLSHSKELRRDPQAEPAIEVEHNALRRVASTSAPSLDPELPRDRSPSRADLGAVVAVSPVPVASPAVTRSQRTAGHPRPQPARTALTKSAMGSQGVGQSPNLGRAKPAPESPATVSSGSARRPRATQQAAPGPALTPAQQALISRSRSQAAVPDAVFRAEPAAVATVSGAPAPGDSQATASAAANVQRANVRTGPVTAAKGSLDIDLGPTRIVSARQSGSASGGGQPKEGFPNAGPAAGPVNDGRRPATGCSGGPHRRLPAAPSEAGGGVPPGGPRAAVRVQRQVDQEAPMSDRRSSVAQQRSVADLNSVQAAGKSSLQRSADDAGSVELRRAIEAAARSRHVRGPSAMARVAARPPAAATPVEPRMNTGRPPSNRDLEAVRPGAQSGKLTRTDNGVVAPAASGSAAALAGRSTVDPTTADQVGGETGGTRRRRRDDNELASNELASNVTGGAASLPKQAPRAGVSTGTVATAAIAEPPPAEPPTTEPPTTEPPTGDVGGMGDLVGDLEVRRLSQPSAGAITVEAPLPEDLGGVGDRQAVEVGRHHRLARIESVLTPLHAAQLIRRDVGGTPNWSTSAVVAAEAYRRRGRRQENDAEAGGRGAPSPQTEEAIELGLRFLAQEQLPDGSWSLNRIDEEVALVSDTAATGLALLALQGAGYHHKEHKYADVVAAGVAFLLKHQKADGDLFLPLDDESNRSVWLYSHSIGALALSEAYGMTQDPQLREPTQRAIDFIVASQHKDRGGWRYSPKYGSDTSVTGWMMMALKSGELANLKAPAETYRGIRRWLELSQASRDEPHLYRYNPFAPDTPTQRHGRLPSKTMTAVGLLMRLYGGWRRDDPDLIRGAGYLQQHPPAVGSTRAPQRDTYYWYYATQVMFHMGGQYWESWNQRLHPLLVDSQIKNGSLAGSWDPYHPTPDRWAPHAGRLYVTTMNLLSLEVYYRLLPLYDETAK